MKLVLTFLLAALSLCAFACDDPGDVDCCSPPPPPTYLPPTTGAAVLNNLELAYRNQQLTRYEEVLDENFTFFFYSGDVGGDIPAQWGRQEELDANKNLFDKNWVDPDPTDGITEPCKKIAMDVKWEDGLQWQTITQDSGEDWFTATVFYNFQFDVGEDDHFVNNPGAKAQFTVRNAGTEEDPHWQLVEMRDLGGNSSMAAAVSTDQSTWGHVKAAYR